MPKVKVNGNEIEVAAGINVIEAAKQAGVEIPHYCYHPHLSIAGNCRMCVCETETPRGNVMEIACNMQVREGMVIHTETDKVKAARKSVMEFLLVNHPLDCPICDQSGECRLQDYYMDHGAYDSRGVEAKVSKHKRQDIGDKIVLDAERCVQCSRCVRFGDEVTGTGELRLMNRGDHTEIGMFPGERLGHDYQENLADICPVGALTSKEFRFERRVWYLSEGDGVCTGCSTGCNTTIGHQKGEVFRYQPRRNDVVNKSWMCDPGRDTYKQIGGLSRLLSGTVNGKQGPALAEAATRIKTAKSPGFVLGSQATNEANWALVQLAKIHRPDAKFFHVSGNDAGAIGKSDSFLIDGDKNPNSYGVRLLSGIVSVGDAAALRDSGCDVLVVLEDDIVSRLGSVPNPTIIYLGWKRSSTVDAATVVLPVTHPVEMDGTFVNRQGIVQRVRRVVNTMGDAAPAYAVLERIGLALGKSLGTSMPVASFLAMSRAIPRMNGLDYKNIGSQGKAIAPEPTPEPAAASPEAK